MLAARAPQAKIVLGSLSFSLGSLISTGVEVNKHSKEEIQLQHSIPESGICFELEIHIICAFVQLNDQLLKITRTTQRTRQHW